ncbi:MAG TPA: NnrS family protein [Terriglobales bacterium]|nr:NnrS family protein [Terriglobales bacterium]
MVITENSSVAEIVKAVPGARRIFDKHGLHGCGGEHGPSEPLSFFAAVHQADLKGLLEELNAEAQRPQAEDPHAYSETLPDYIYRRFFKAGVAIMLTVGGLWGAVNLLQIALKKNFLQLYLLPAIHAHAHAMVFGWVGLFVMGFAYQSFPRFKNTSLWRPELANLSFYLMLTGIGTRMAGELTAPAGLAYGLGAIAAITELAAIVIFLVVLFRTARQSVEPRNRYEKFLLGAFFWFLVQAILSDVFFFAKITASTQDELIHRIALIDGPLRDLQLLGFAALIIAGVSQRFVPLVYGLAKPKRDRLDLIFWLMNGSLVLNVACYVGLLSAMFFGATRQVPLGSVAGLELAYLLMPVWVLLLVRQLGIFSRPTQPDRTFKFVRAAYVWLLISAAMLPLFMMYGVLTHQGFAHSYMGSYRHAFTVGFISLMIMGVSARVVPILAGVDAKSLSSLWGPFVLLNLGCLGRVTLQIATDFVPRVAYPLVGATGFIEIAALAWWGWELWRVMNLSKTHRAAVLRPPQLVTISR